jgi:FAD:protein FMN transferase
MKGSTVSVRLERRLFLMGTSLDLTIDAVDRPHALAASEVAVAAIERADARLSTWRDDSELARFNRAPAGEPQTLSPALSADLSAARSCWERTGGAFDPGIGALVEAWGLRGGGRVPGADELRRAVEAGGTASLVLGPGDLAVRGKAGLLIEEGGFGKGAALADAVAALRGSPGLVAAQLDFGGQVAFVGAGAFPIAVADPTDRERPVLTFTVGSGSVATSGNSERGVTVAGERYGHILDPRSGQPVPDFGSVTVWAADAFAADCLSKLYVLGPEGAMRWAAAHPDVQVLVLRRDRGGLTALASAGLRGRIEPLAGSVRVRFW